MKEFVVYTALRLLLGVATFGIVVGVWSIVADDPNLFVAILVGFVVSGVGSYFLLDAQREALARRVQERATRATAAFEERRAREDAEESKP